MRWPEWPKKVAPETIDRHATKHITIAAGDIAVGLASKWKDLPRAAIESLALEAYRSRALTAAQLRRLLVFETRTQVEAFLKEHEIIDYSAADF